MRFLALAVAIVACTPTYPPVTYLPTEAPAAAEELKPAVVYGPVDHPAALWNEAIVARTSHESDAVFSGLYELAREKGDPERDARLDLAAAELAEVAGHGVPLDDALVDFALRQHGVVDAPVLVLTATATEPDAIVAELAPQLGNSLYVANVHVGLGGMGPMVLVVTHTSLVTLAPGTPRFVDAHGDATIVATLDPMLHAPRVTITHEDGTVERPAVALLDPLTFVTSFQCGDHTRAQWVLVEACDDKNTNMRLLLFPIDCATRGADTYRVEPRENATTRDLEGRLASLLNRERADAKLAPLAGDRRAAVAARTEARLMRSSGRIDHELGGTTTTTRLRDAGLVPPMSREATLHAPDLATASELLMNEPAYRLAVLAPEVTHVGLAIERDAHGELDIAVELVQIVPKIDVDRLRADVLARLRARLPYKVVLPEHPLLDKLAREYAIGRAHGWSEPDMIAFMELNPSLVYGPFETMRRSLTLLLHEVATEVDLGPKTLFDRVGVAVVQAPRDGALAGRIWVVILFGKLRPKG